MPEPDLIVVMPVDLPPNRWAEEHPSPTLAEIEAGEALRVSIDVDDDTDSGANDE
jgi:hypothetical protein